MKFSHIRGLHQLGFYFVFQPNETHEILSCSFFVEQFEDELQASPNNMRDILIIISIVTNELNSVFYSLVVNLKRF